MPYLFLHNILISALPVPHNILISALPYHQPLTREEREAIGRLRNCILALASHKVMLFDTTIQYTYEASLKYEVSGVHYMGQAKLSMGGWSH